MINLINYYFICKDWDLSGIFLEINLLRAIEWSKTIDETFKQNHEKFPQISFQYFGSVLGFIRVYPAYPWKVKLDDDQPNVYDCRTTKWYICFALI